MNRFCQNIYDKYRRAAYGVQLLFTKDEKKRKELLICQALCSFDGRNLLAKAMVEGTTEQFNRNRSIRPTAP